MRQKYALLLDRIPEKLGLTSRASRANVPAAHAGGPGSFTAPNISRRRVMRHSVPAALVAILFSVQAAAQDDEDEKKGKGKEK